MSLVTKTGEIVVASERFMAAVLCEDETITCMDGNIALSRGAEVVDAKGKFVSMPGQGEFLKRTPNHFWKLQARCKPRQSRHNHERTSSVK